MIIISPSRPFVGHVVYRWYGRRSSVMLQIIVSSLLPPSCWFDHSLLHRNGYGTFLIVCKRLIQIIECSLCYLQLVSCSARVSLPPQIRILSVHRIHHSSFTCLFHISIQHRRPRELCCQPRGVNSSGPSLTTAEIKSSGCSEVGCLSKRPLYISQCRASLARRPMSGASKLHLWQSASWEDIGLSHWRPSE